MGRASCRHRPQRFIVSVPASKSLTNRYLILAALASSPSTIHNTLISRDTELMLDALAAFGIGIERTTQPDGSTTVAIIPGNLATGPLSIDCGLAGTVMRFVPPLAAVPVPAWHSMATKQPACARWPRCSTHWKPWVPRWICRHPRACCPSHGAPARVQEHHEVLIDASGSSQFISALLLVSQALPGGLKLRAAAGHIASPDHIAMTVQTLRELGVEVAVGEDARSWSRSHRVSFRVHYHRGTGPVQRRSLPSAAALATNGTVRVPFWPASATRWVANESVSLSRMGAEISHREHGVLTVRGTEVIRGIDYADASELAPTLAALCTLAATPSELTGIGHLRGHETDRLAALETELAKVDVPR